MKSEKETLENILTQKANDVRKSMATDVQRVDDEMKRTFTAQKSENNKLQ